MMTSQEKLTFQSLAAHADRARSDYEGRNPAALGECMKYVQHDSYVLTFGRERLLDAAEPLRDALETILFCMEESHADEIASDHYGDGPDGCSYCEAIAKSQAALMLAGGQEDED